MIEIRLNGEKKYFDKFLKVDELLNSLGLLPGSIIVELNGEVLPRDSYERRSVENGDSVELIRLIGGG